ncbi:endospore germination permease [Bacillus sp. 37MA]|uniref:GerAB/ArcD/ProY family transporter n=1 Tax=Bacillus sp. 37MA TaxID=1132442 RepID=UPI0003A79702|nr:endospore germination permease [Bacillus sp. 37MA]
MKSPATISPVQLFFIILQTQIGIGLLSLPYTVQEGAGKDGWISILLAGLFVQGGIAVIWLLSSRFPGLTFYDFAPLLVGRIIGTVLTMMYILFFFAMVCYQLSYFLAVSSNWAFPRTPHVIFAVLAVAVSVYLAKENLRIIGRFHNLASFLLVSIIFVLLPLIPHFEMRYLLPFASNGVEDIMRGAGKAVTAFAGFELLLWLYPFTEGSKTAKWKAVAGANAATSIIYAILAFASSAIFSPEEIKVVPEPVLYIMKEAELIVVERIDLLFLTVWAVLVLTSLISYLYVASTGLTHLLKAKEHKKSLYVLAVLVIPVAIANENRMELMRIGDKINSVSIILLFVIPAFLLMVALIRKKREESV